MDKAKVWGCSGGKLQVRRETKNKLAVKLNLYRLD